MHIAFSSFIVWAPRTPTVSKSFGQHYLFPLTPRGGRLIVSNAPILSAGPTLSHLH